MPLAAGGWAGILKTQDTTHVRGAEHELSALKLSAEEAIPIRAPLLPTQEWMQLSRRLHD